MIDLNLLMESSLAYSIKNASMLTVLIPVYIQRDRRMSSQEEESGEDTFVDSASTLYHTVWTAKKNGRDENAHTCRPGLHYFLPVYGSPVSGPVVWSFLLISCTVPRTVGFPLLCLLTGWDP
jgi:hypothetical protein